MQPGRESAVDEMDFLTLEIGHDPRWKLDHLVDAPPDTAGGENAGIAGYAGIGGVDSSGIRAGMPLIDGIVELHAWISAAPGGKGDLFPKVAGLERLGDMLGAPEGQIPVAILLDEVEELVGDAHGVVGILPRYGVIGFAIEIIIKLELQTLGQELLIARQRFEALGHGGHFQLFANLPVYKLFDIGVIEVEADHLGRPTRGATRLDSAGRPIADLEETHQP